MQRRKFLQATFATPLETGGKALDQLDPDTFKYTITAYEVKA